MTTTLNRPVGPSSSPPPADRSVPTGAPVSIGPTFLTAAAILTGASALGTPISGSSWVLPLIEVVTVIWLVGVGGRLIRLPTIVTVLLQLIGFTVALTSLFTVSGIGGVLPNGAAVSEAGALLSGAWDQIVGTSPPAPSTPELSFLISLAIGCAAFIADFLVAEARSPALVALPLLCLYSVPASIATTMLPWYTFAAPAVLYAGLLAVTGHRDRRTGTRAGLGLAVNGGAIIAAAVVVSLLIANSVTGIGTTGRLPKTSGGGSTIGLSPFTSLKGNLKSSAAVNLLTVSGLAAPDYLRTIALTDWISNKGWGPGDLAADVPDANGPITDLPALTTDLQVTVNSANYQDKYLPIYTGTRALSGLTSSWQFDAGLDTVFRSEKVKPGQYGMTVNPKKPTPAELEADTVAGGGALTETGSLPALVRETAAQVTQDETTAFDKAKALEEYFTDPANGFVYSLQVPDGNSGDLLVDFLQGKQGFCEQYASAMAVMLRSLNIPSRVVVGFTQGVKQADGDYLITSHDAHAWVEVKFASSGWVRFDPTPPVNGQGGLNGFQNAPAAPATSASKATTTVTSSARSNTIPETKTRATRTTAVATQVDVASGAGGSTSRWLTPVLIVLAALVVLFGLLMIPTLVRLSRRRRRMTLARAGGEGAAAAAWAEIEDTAIDHGILPHASESARVTANRLARRAHLGEDERRQLREVVVAAEREWYGHDGVRGADEGSGSGSTMTLAPPASRVELAAGVTSIIAGLIEHAPNRLADRVFPRSMHRAR